jgi:hypothetical protein
MDDAYTGGKMRWSEGGKRARRSSNKIPFVAAMRYSKPTTITITGTCRVLRPSHAARYLAAYEYRFNRRTDLASMPPRLAFVALRFFTSPYRLLVPANVLA